MFNISVWLFGDFYFLFSEAVQWVGGVGGGSVRRVACIRVIHALLFFGHGFGHGFVIVFLFDFVCFLFLLFCFDFVVLDVFVFVLVLLLFLHACFSYCVVCLLFVFSAVCFSLFVCILVSYFFVGVFFVANVLVHWYCCVSVIVYSLFPLSLSLASLLSLSLPLVFSSHSSLFISFYLLRSLSLCPHMYICRIVCCLLCYFSPSLCLCLIFFQNFLS